MSYAVKSNEGSFDIIEKPTNVTIVLNADERKAKDICRKLNLGSGFNGWTPEFFSMKYNTTYTEEE